MYKMKKFKQIFILAVTLVILYQFALSIDHNDPNNNSNVLSNNFQRPNKVKVVIGAVYCRKPESAILKDSYYDQTIVMIKSALISCHLFKIPTLEIHLFLEHVKEDQTYFKKEILQQMTIPGVTVILQIYSAVDTIPPKYRDHMLYHFRFRCGYVRFFFPDVLPNVDSIIHLDSDMIITGDLTKHWDLLSEMDDHQMVAMIQDTPTESKVSLKTYYYFFGPTPHVPPRGVNAGLLVMNLTRMRKLGMSEKLTRIYEDYSKFTEILSGQRVINILLYFNPDMLLIMPCNLNFMGNQCEHDKFYCEAALEDPVGIHLIHGTTHRFLEGKVFAPIYKFYKMFNISTVQNSAKMMTTLIQPIKQAYSIADGKSASKCIGTLDKVLFKNVL